MSHPTRRRKRSWPRTILLLVFVLAAVIGVCHCLVRKPVLAPAPAESSAQSLPQSQTDASQSAPADTRRDDDFIILISGMDDDNGGSDTNILVNFDAGRGAIHCVSIPRDSGVYYNGKIHKVNVPSKSGIGTLADTLSATLGIPVDYTVQVDLRGFVKLVDMIGGVDFNVPVNMDYDDPTQDLHIHFSKGLQHLSGAEALRVVRFRHNNDGSGYGSEDIGRIGTQQAFLKAVAKQTLTLSNVDKIPGLAKLFHEYVDSTLKVSELAWLGQKAVSIGADGITFDTLPGAWSGRRSVYLLDRDAVLALVNTSLNPFEQDRTADQLSIPD